MEVSQEKERRIKDFRKGRGKVKQEVRRGGKRDGGLSVMALASDKEMISSGTYLHLIKK